MPATLPLLFRPFRRVPLQADRKQPQLPCLAVPSTRLACVAQRLFPVLRPLHRPNSARTTLAALTKTKNLQLASALLESVPARAGVFPIPNVPCTFPALSFQVRKPCRPSSLDPFPAAPAPYLPGQGQKQSAQFQIRRIAERINTPFGVR